MLLRRKDDVTPLSKITNKTWPKEESQVGCVWQSSKRDVFLINSYSERQFIYLQNF